MPNQVSGKIQEERSHILIELSDKNEKEYLDKNIDKAVKVLFEEKEGEYYKGHTSNYLMIKVKSNNDISNKILDVKIISRDNLELMGTLL